MCMKNINVSAVFCDQDLSELCGAVKLGEFIDEIEVVPSSDGRCNVINNLTVVTIVSAISDSNDPELQKKYDILWTFEPMGADINERRQLAIDTLDLKKNKFDSKSFNVCRSFSNQIFKFTVRGLEITSVDKPYWLKIFLKEKDEDKYEIQSINSIKVINHVE